MPEEQRIEVGAPEAAEAPEAADAPEPGDVPDSPADDPPPADGRPDEPDGSVGSPAGGDGDDDTDWRDVALRKAAELENVRKQSAQRVQKATRDGMRRVAVELLPALDDFERALAAAEAGEADAEHGLTKGIRLVQQQLLGALARAGIEPYSPQGEAFDPHLHEAVATTPVEGAQSGTVVEVYGAGYRLGDDVLRAAKVVVAA